MMQLGNCVNNNSNDDMPPPPPINNEMLDPLPSYSATREEEIQRAKREIHKVHPTPTRNNYSPLINLHYVKCNRCNKEIKKTSFSKHYAEYHQMKLHKCHLCNKRHAFRHQLIFNLQNKQ